MKAQLLHNTPLHIASTAIRTCWQSQDKSDTPTRDEYIEQEILDNGFVSGERQCGPNDKALIDRVGNKNKHSSTLEHLSYTFYISDVSRALLQELARHRMASLSVKSSRYTLTELKSEEPFIYYDGSRLSDEVITDESWFRAGKYLVFTGEDEIDVFSIRALENLRKAVGTYTNDKAKYCLPESYKTELTWTINARSLQNFISLRSSKSALWEIRDLAKLIYNTLPDDHKYLYQDLLGD